MPRPPNPESQEQVLYRQWKENPSPENLDALLKHLQPQINQSARMYVGRNDPILQSRARLLLIKALPRYDPREGTLKTFATQQLLALIREGRSLAQPIKIPERQALLRGQLYLAEKELTDRLMRPPSDAELADYTGISIQQITKIRQLSGHLTESQVSSAASNEGGGWTPATRHRQPAWAEVVYHDLEPRDQKILEWTLGLHGVKPLSNNEIARRLKVSPSLVSQRKAMIQKHIDTVSRFQI